MTKRQLEQEWDAMYRRMADATARAERAEARAEALQQRLDAAEKAWMAARTTADEESARVAATGWLAEQVRCVVETCTEFSSGDFNGLRVALATYDATTATGGTGGGQ